MIDAPSSLPDTGRDTDRKPALEFDHVTVAGGHRYDSGLWEITFTLREGEMMLVRVGSEHARVPLACVAEGLLMPDDGSVRVLGVDWRSLSWRRSAEHRGNIGRVFSEPAWLSELSVAENLTLAQRHHSDRSEEDIRNDAAALARFFSLPGLPQGPVASVRRQDLQRAACVRAFLGKPRLLILEEPTSGIYPQVMPALMAAIRAARQRGAAVLWITADQRVWSDRGIPAAIRATMSGAQLRLQEGAVR